MKIIFLDIDGVLNTSETKEPIDLNKVKHLSTIVKSTGAKIVLSSSWKILNDPNFPGYAEYLYLTECLASEGLSIIDQTPGPCHNRPREIRQWLEQHPHVLSWVSLDDDFRPDQYTSEGLDSDRLIKTSYSGSYAGLCEDHIAWAIAILNDELDYPSRFFNSIPDIERSIYE